MNEYLIPALTVALPSIGFIAGALFAGGKNQSLMDAADEYAARLRKRIDLLLTVNSAMFSEIAAHQAERERRLAPLQAANAKRSAEATASRHLRMEAAEQRSAMKEAAE